MPERKVDFEAAKKIFEISALVNFVFAVAHAIGVVVGQLAVVL